MSWNLPKWRTWSFVALVALIAFSCSAKPRAALAAEPTAPPTAEQTDPNEPAPLEASEPQAGEASADPYADPYSDPYAEPAPAAEAEVADEPAPEATGEPAPAPSAETSDTEDEPQPLEPAGEPAPLPTALPPADDPAPPAETSDETASAPSLDPASLDGVQPGKTTRDELHQRWGEPAQAQRVAGGAREFYELKDLGRVQASIFEDTVDALVVQIKDPKPFAEIAQRLDLNGIEPAEIFDESGDHLGAAFPERGVLLGYLPKARPTQVFQIVIEPLDAQPFIARAEARLDGRYAESLADVKQALAIAPEHPQAHHLHGELMLRHGRLEESLQSAQRAAELEPTVAGHRLLVARALATAGDYPAAITLLRNLLEEPQLPPLDAARAALYYGDYLGQSSKRDFAAAIKEHQRAIQLAEPLMTSKSRSERRAAKEVLLGAHLGVAYDIGHGRWQQKTAAVAKWIDRAAVFADDLMRKENAGAEPRLDVYVGALAAITGIDSPPDVSKWVAGTRELGQKLYDKASDPARRAELAWQLGRALSEAVEIETAGGRGDEAIALGNVAEALLEAAGPVAGNLPTYFYQCGRLSYRIGAAYAVTQTDHVQAVVWFERASPLLESPVPAAAIESGEQGETFVSMAVSYWEEQDRNEALRLTNQGLKLMEQAVADGTLEAAALAVPYGNLSVMHEELGDAEQAKWCADLARRYEDSATK